MRIDPNFASIVNTFVNEGRTNYDAVQFGIEKRPSANYQARIAYTWSKGRGNTSANGAPVNNFQLLNDMRLDLNEGPTDFDRTHNFVFGGAAVVPHTGITVSSVVRYLSGQPFTIQDTTLDNDRNGILFEPLPAGNYSGVGRNPITVESDGGRNGARGPSFFQVDMRLGYRFKLGDQRRVEAFAEVYNLTNRANFANPNGDRFATTTFLNLTALRAGGDSADVAAGSPAAVLGSGESQGGTGTPPWWVFATPLKPPSRVAGLRPPAPLATLAAAARAAVLCGRAALGARLHRRTSDERRHERLRLVHQDVLRVQRALDHDAATSGSPARAKRSRAWRRRDQPVRRAVRQQQRRGRDAIDDAGQGRRGAGGAAPRASGAAGAGGSGAGCAAGRR